MPIFGKSSSGSRKRCVRTRLGLPLQLAHFIHRSVPRHNARSFSPRVPARLLPPMPADALPHLLPQKARRRARRRKTPSVAGCSAPVGRTTHSTNTVSYKAPRRGWTTFSPRDAKCSTTSLTSAPCSKVPSVGCVMPPIHLGSVATLLVGLIGEGTHPRLNAKFLSHQFCVGLIVDPWFV